MPKIKLACSVRMFGVVLFGGFLITASALATQLTPAVPPSAERGSAPPASIARPRNELSDAEPVDPAEQRPAVFPPARPDRRGVAVSWQQRGPAPTQSAQVNVPPADEVCGAIQSIAAHPSNAAIIYIGAVNGGIWMTSNATAAQPTWVAQTADLPSQSIGAIAFDPTDATNQTLLAGTGRLGNFAQRGDDEIGVYRSIDGGANWSMLGGATLLGQKIVAVAARGPILMAASNNGGLFRSINSGANWTLVSGSNGLPTGGIFDLVGDAGDNARFYIAVRGTAPKLLRSDNSGANWIDVTTGVTGLVATTSNIKLSVGASSTLFAVTVDTGSLNGVFRSANQGSNWTAMDVPVIHPGGQGFPNTSIAADPANANRVYLGGDRISSSPFTGNLVRGDATLAAGSQFVTIMDGNAGNTSPHADSRDLAFDASGNLLESDDGGIYRRSSPTSSAGTWGSVIGNLNVIEVHDLVQDRVANIIFIGTQDNGTHMQQTAANLRWTFINGGDGGDVAADNVTVGPAASFRYLSFQGLGGFSRDRYSSANAFLGSLTLPTIADPQFVTPIALNAADPGRLLVGGVNTLYESTNVTTATPTLTTLGAPGANRNAMTYGTNADSSVAYVGKGAAVFKRSGSVFVATGALPAGANTITDVVLDPSNGLRVFAVDDNQVFRSINAGDTWQDITGNLTSVSSLDFRTIEYIDQGSNDTVAVGTRSGVFTTAADSNVWGLLGAGLPDVLVFDLQYVASSNTLIAGTLGRGVWSHSFVIELPFANGFEN